MSLRGLQALPELLVLELQVLQVLQGLSERQGLLAHLV